VEIPAIMLTMYEKQVLGSLFGSANIRKDIPRLFELYLQGQLNLDDLVTRTYTFDQINEGYEAMRRGENIRGVMLFD
jgi:S-(hydroxymethyl)glutathione dehydrogenase/alcohol dehydrogenase